MRDWPIRSWPLNLTDRDHNAILTTFSADELLDQFLIIHRQNLNAVWLVVQRGRGFVTRVRGGSVSGGRIHDMAKTSRPNTPSLQ
jgi:hypothetical protein